MNKGWRNEPYRHGLAGRGISVSTQPMQRQRRKTKITEGRIRQRIVDILRKDIEAVTNKKLRAYEFESFWSDYKLMVRIFVGGHFGFYGKNDPDASWRKHEIARMTTDTDYGRFIEDKDIDDLTIPLKVEITAINADVAYLIEKSLNQGLTEREKKYATIEIGVRE